MTAPRIPVYMQVADSLVERIEQDGWAPGHRMAPERALAEEFGVNRRTVRQALGVLERRGLVERRQGSGTFISAPRLERGASEFFHFTDGIRQRGFAAGSRVLNFERMVPSRLVADELDHGVVDTTGAGDLYASGVLVGLSRGASLESAARLGSIAAAEIIGHLGARPEADLAAIADQILG